MKFAGQFALTMTFLGAGFLSAEPLASAGFVQIAHPPLPDGALAYWKIAAFKGGGVLLSKEDGVFKYNPATATWSFVTSYRPAAMASDDVGHLYVITNDNHRVAVYDGQSHLTGFPAGFNWAVPGVGNQPGGGNTICPTPGQLAVAGNPKTFWVTCPTSGVVYSGTAGLNWASPYHPQTSSPLFAIAGNLGYGKPWIVDQGGKVFLGNTLYFSSGTIAYTAGTQFIGAMSGGDQALALVDTPDELGNYNIAQYSGGGSNGSWGEWYFGSSVSVQNKTTALIQSLEYPPYQTEIFIDNED